MRMKLLIQAFEQVVCQFAEGDIPPVPKPLLFIYIDIEKRLMFERIGFINLDDLFAETTMKNRERFEFMRLMKHYGLIEYVNLGQRNFKVRLLPKSKCFMSGAITMHPASSLMDMVEIIERLKTKEEIND